MTTSGSVLESTELQTLEVAILDRIATVRLNRPEVRNAFHPNMIAELSAVFRALSKRADIAAVVLCGNGKSFSAGADLAYMKSMAAFSLAENEQDSALLFEMFASLRSCTRPVIARLHGHVMGGALGLAAACDIAAAVDGTQFCFSEVKLGLAPAVISPFVLEKMLSSHARRWMLTGEVFNTEQALSSGLIHHRGDAESVDRFISGITGQFLQNGPEAVSATKSLLAQVSAAGWPERKSLTTRLIAERRVSAEGQEGLRGFLEKREPAWRRST